MDGVSLRLSRQAWCSFGRGVSVTIHLSAPGGGHCEQAGRARRPRWWGCRTSQDAARLDRRVAQVRVMDPHHPLYGKRFEVSDQQARNAALIIIRLPDGRERMIARAATSLGPTRNDVPPAPSRDAHISVRTLLPLANHVRAVLASRHGDLERGRLAAQAPAPELGGTRRNARGTATPVARASAREAASDGAASGSSAATPALPSASGGGETLC